MDKNKNTKQENIQPSEFTPIFRKMIAECVKVIFDILEKKHKEDPEKDD